MFDLTPEIKNQIVFALEDQNNSYVIHMPSGRVVDKSLPKDGEEDLYTSLPEWGPANGFRMMERFVSIIHNEPLQKKLRSVLFSGKGVFRNFKNILKEYPESESLWFSFKEKEMTLYITQWYNMLRENVGLEKLGEEPEENEDLVYDDFTVREYNSVKDKDILLSAANSVMAEREVLWPGEIGIALSHIWQQTFNVTGTGKTFSFVAETVEGEFAGCIVATSCPSYAQHTVVLTLFFVVQNYRGLGIGKELLAKCLETLKQNNIRWVILNDIVIPDFLQPCLFRNGFVFNGGGYVADLFL